MNLQEKVGIDFPLFQAPMAGVQGSALAMAVSQAGGLGALPCAMLSPEKLRGELEVLNTRLGTRFNLNFFCHQPPSIDQQRQAQWRDALLPYYREYNIDPGGISTGVGRRPFDAEAAEMVEEFAPAVVSFHFGLPEASLLSRVKATGATVLSTATTVAEARWLEEQGADAIIAQGIEAGGHRGMFLTADLNSQLGTFALLPQVVNVVSVPVIAAGGIADAQGVAAAMQLGAAGVQVGTSYLLCKETDTSPVHRAALKDQQAAQTAITNVHSGRPARGIVNRIVRELGPLSAKAPPFPLASAALAPVRAAAEAQGSGDFSPLWSGQNASGVREVSAGELTRELAKAFEGF